MKRKPIRALISLLLVLALSTGALAVNPDAMTDIAGHWAREDIRYCLENNLFNGTSATTFTPNDEMTRGMFVTVLGRIAGIGSDTYDTWYVPYIYCDVPRDKYYSPYVSWATRFDIVNGKGDGRFAPDEPITREQMATMISRFTRAYGCGLTQAGTVTARFTDAGAISSWAVDAVEEMRIAGILNGYPDGRFAPKDTATRAMCAKVFHLLNTSLSPSSYAQVWSSGITLSATSLDMKIDNTATLRATISPASCINQKVTWFSSDTSIVRVDNNGKVTAVSGGSADIYAMSCNRTATCTVTVQPDASLTYAGESEYDKCMRLFGCYLTERERDVYYLGTGGRHVTSVQVPVWRIDSSGNKYGSSLYLNVHINLAATVKAIFTDIYNGPEKFPIYSAGGYRDERGEHGAGMAIDINAYENGEFVFSGGTLVPTANWFWAPGENPYSIPPNGDVVKAFKKYGWGWGGEWRSKRDYMHFSYFHT